MALGRCRLGETVKEIPNAIPLPGVWQSVCRGLVFVLVSGKRQAKQGSQINTHYPEKQIKPQITRKGSEVMALRARLLSILARSAIPDFLSV